MLDRTKLAYQNLGGSGNNWQAGGANIRGSFFRQSQWKRSSERVLLFDSVHPAFTINYATALDYASKWPFKPEGTLDFPDSPEGATFTLDFNRHGKRALGNKASDPSMNALYCDGHASTASCREVYRGMRFN